MWHWFSRLIMNTNRIYYFQRRIRTVTQITVTHQASNTFISLAYVVREERLSNTNWCVINRKNVIVDATLFFLLIWHWFFGTHYDYKAYLLLPNCVFKIKQIITPIKMDPSHTTLSLDMRSFIFTLIMEITTLPIKHKCLTNRFYLFSIFHQRKL